MTRNDLFYKILFAIEIALLPIVIFADMFIADWTMGLFISAILVCKIWREIFKNRDSRSHHIIGCIASILVFVTLIVYFMSIDVINLAIGIVAVVAVVIMQLFDVFTFNKRINDTIKAVDSCYMIFECLTLVSLVFAIYDSMTTNIGLFAIILTALVSVGYKVYYIFKYTDLVGNIKSIFKKK
ncbi:MAG: hypothetical protein IKC49_03550 [Clostridia bacterium]|nr:hypothetical protein [Clostridia bacterium]